MMSKWREIEKKYYMPTFQRMPVVLVRGRAPGCGTTTAGSTSISSAVWR